MSEALTRAIAEHCVDLRFEALSREVVEIAGLSILDNLGCAFVSASALS